MMQRRNLVLEKLEEELGQSLLECPGSERDASQRVL